jgi:hypothetical protein
VLRAYTVGKRLLQMFHDEGVTVIRGEYTPRSRPTNKRKTTAKTAVVVNDVTKMNKKQLVTHAKKLGVVLPKHIVKANIIKLIRNKKRPTDVTGELLKLFGKNWLTKYELYSILDFPKDVKKVTTLLNQVPANKHSAVMRAYVNKVKKNRVRNYDSLLKTLNNVLTK